MKKIFLSLLVLFVPVFAGACEKADGLVGGCTKLGGHEGLMSGSGLGFGLGFGLIHISILIWSVVGVLAAVWLWKQISKK